MTDQQAVAATRARFWRRFFAFVLDAMAVGFVIGLFGLVLFEPTNGRIRASNFLIDMRRCETLNPRSVHLDLPDDFRATHATLCTRSFFGRVHDRSLTVAEVTRSGSVTYTRTISVPSDADGQPTRAFYLDYLFVFLMIGYLLLAEWRFGTTFGKRLLGLGVRSVATHPMSLSQATKRQLVLFIPLYPVLVPAFALLAMPYSQWLGLLKYIFPIGILSALLLVIMLVNFVRAVRRGELPWHDRWAQTEVIRQV